MTGRFSSSLHRPCLRSIGGSHASCTWNTDTRRRLQSCARKGRKELATKFSSQLDRSRTWGVGELRDWLGVRELGGDEEGDVEDGEEVDSNVAELVNAGSSLAISQETHLASLTYLGSTICCATSIKLRIFRYIGVRL